jgi:hypothetical protein
MIIFETLWKITAQLTYAIIRLFIWLFAARECKRCEHYYCGSGRSAYCHCKMNDMAECFSRPWRPHFKRRPRKNRKFFDILK